MTELNLPVSSPSKRAKIRELTLAGLSPKAIVDKLGTSVQYVYKERGRLRADGFSITHQASFNFDQPEQKRIGSWRIKEKCLCGTKAVWKCN